MKKTKFSWIPFYQELADRILEFKDNRTALIEKVKLSHKEVNKNLPKIEKNNDTIPDIDPFTVFALFNRGKQSDEARIALCKGYKKAFSIKATVPSDFDGIPTFNYNQYCFYRYVGDPKREPKCFDTLWDLFEKAIAYSNDGSNKESLATTFEKALRLPLVGLSKLTIALYQIRPYTFISLDNNNKQFLTDVDNMPHYFTTIFSSINKDIPTGTNYLFMCEQARNALKNDEYEYHSFPELSYHAYANKRNTETQDIDSDVKETNYWIYSPGDNACMWDEFYENGIMGIGWDEVSNLKDFASKEEIKKCMKEVYDASYSYKNHAHCLWQFANEMKVGDVIFAKKGLHKIIGKGVVTSDYIYDAERKSYKHIRKVQWINKGEWKYPADQAAMKTLTCLSSYPDSVQKLLNLFVEDAPEEITEQKEIKYPTYTKEDFLNEVYMGEDLYNILTGLLETKYNVILQGAPGVGKTFVAKRLAYSIMGQKDTSRVAMVQFHQSYSYEDFIQGYRPTKKEFKLENGVFYKFCKDAEEDNERPYFFIIDEINRGNLSKIFGELMMLIEKDKRGEKIKLLYSNEWFNVPNNVRIIGMMNTADRSLALMDYALRRRFAFFDFAPAFSSEGFKNYLAEKNSPKLEKLIAVIESLNNTISTDESLGDGFRIGHSYFCTEKEISDEWLKSVVEFEVIPLIKEYWFDEPTKVRDWSATLRSAIK